MQDSAAVIIVPRSSLLTRIEISPPSLLLRANAAASCGAAGYDSSGNPYKVAVEWWSNGGVIDTTGLFTAGPDTGLYIITAQEATYGLCDTIAVHILPVLKRMVLSPEYLQLQVNTSGQFTAHGYGAEDEEVKLYPAWTAAGGTIDATGTFTAGADTGLFHITVEDTLSRISASAQVHVVLATAVSDGQPLLPTAFALGNNYPNPFNPVTTIEYSVKKACHVVIRIYDIRGCEVTTLMDGYQQPGFYKINFRAGNMATGVYFYRMQTKEFTAVRKMVLLE